MTDQTMVPAVFDPLRWGLPDEAVAYLGDRLGGFWARYRECFQPRTRDASAHAWTYLRGLLGLDTKCNFANIARRVVGPDDDGQNVQHFMSDSPWSAQTVIQQVQREIAAPPSCARAGCCFWMKAPMKRLGPRVRARAASVTGGWARSR